jgi:CRP/FNR family cyclic AMP-dependent transcriptional regulator
MTSDLLDKESLIGQSKIFGLLDLAGRQKLVGIGRPSSLRSGEMVIREGELDATFYLLVKGKVEVSIDKFGAECTVNVLEEGAVFGEIAALVGEDRSATVKALTDIQLLEFDGEKIQELLSNYPQVREAIMKLGLKRSEDTMHEMLSDD